MYTEEDIIYWIKHKDDDLTKLTSIVSNKKDFPMICNLTKNCTNIAYISIESTEKCAKFCKFSHDNTHYLENSENVLNIEFDDVEEDNEVAKSITEEQAKTIVDFIYKHIKLRNHFIIHCRAGQSRSQAVYKFIRDIAGDIYEPVSININNPCLTPNNKVLTMLKRVIWKSSFNI